MRVLRGLLAGGLLALTWAGAAVATAPPTVPPSVPPSVPSAETGGPTTIPADTATTTVAGTQLPELVEPLEVPPPIADPAPKSAPLVVVPPGCAVPPLPVATFVGTIIAADATTARFEVQQIRAGTLDGYAVGTLVDVRYDDDIRFLHHGQAYLVGAAPDPLSGVLRSKVRTPAPLFGGDAVIGVNDTDVSCPVVEDGVRTLHVDGTGVDSGVLAPLKTSKRSLLRAVAKPVVIGLGVLVALVAIKLLIFAMVRALRDAARDDDEDIGGSPPPLRDRRHVDEVMTAPQ